MGSLTDKNSLSGAATQVLKGISGDLENAADGQEIAGFNRRAVPGQMIAGEKFSTQSMTVEAAMKGNVPG